MRRMASQILIQIGGSTERDPSPRFLTFVKITGHFSTVHIDFVFGVYWSQLFKRNRKQLWVKGAHIILRRDGSNWGGEGDQMCLDW